MELKVSFGSLHVVIFLLLIEIYFVFNILFSINWGLFSRYSQYQWTSFNFRIDKYFQSYKAHIGSSCKVFSYIRINSVLSLNSAQFGVG